MDESVEIKLLIADDHKIVRDGVKAILIGHNTIRIVAEAASGNELLALIQITEFDVLLLDLSFPDYSGLDLIKPILDKKPNSKILILTAVFDEETICETIAKGASGFLHKDASGEELISAIEAIYAGEAYYGQRISEVIFKSYSKRVKESPPTGERNMLSARELEIIRLLGQGLSFKGVAAILSISPRTVENHKNNILEKLELNNTIELLKYAIRNKIIQL